MSWPEIIALAVLPAFLVLDLLKPAARGGDARSRWWRSRAFAVTVFNFRLALKIGELWARCSPSATCRGRRWNDEPQLLNSTSASISTGIENGSSNSPTALRGWAPTSGP